MGKVIYVDDHNDTGPWDGKSLATAFRRVPDGLAVVAQDDQVWLWVGEAVEEGPGDLDADT